MNPCECCRWQRLRGAAGTRGVLIGSAASNSPISDLLYELIGRVAQRLHGEAGLVVLSDPASVALLDAANLDLAEILGEPRLDTLAHGASRGVAIMIAQVPDASAVAQLAALHVAGSLTVLVTETPPACGDASSDYWIVIDSGRDCLHSAAALRPVWRAMVRGVLQLEALSVIDAQAPLPAR